MVWSNLFQHQRCVKQQNDFGGPKSNDDDGPKPNDGAQALHHKTSKWNTSIMVSPGWPKTHNPNIVEKTKGPQRKRGGSIMLFHAAVRSASMVIDVSRCAYRL